MICGIISHVLGILYERLGIKIQFGNPLFCRCVEHKTCIYQLLHPELYSRIPMHYVFLLMASILDTTTIHGQVRMWI